MSQITITVNGKVCTGQAGETILNIAKANGIEIPNLCYDKSVARYGACGMCVVEVEGNPKLQRACSIEAADGMVIHTETARTIEARKIAMELLMSDHDGDCVGPCSLNCPAGTDCQAYVKQIALGNDREAVRIIKEKLPLPASIGRVCPHPCETACRRQYVEQPISIAYLKYFAADNDLASGNPFRPEVKAPTGKRVAIVGGGPGGLTAAYFLAVAGHSVTVYDAMPKMGGMLRYGIPEYRLPKKVLDREIQEIQDLGVTLKNGVKIGRDISFEEIRKSADATVVAIGAWKSSGVGCPGEDQQGVLGGIDFLREVSLGNAPDIGKNVAVVGGGNTAMDACRTAVRLGAEEVYVVYRRTRNEMPAEDIEIEEAMEEGVTFKFLTNPAEILGENGRVKAVKLQVMELGEPDASGRRSPVPVEGKFEMLEVDTVIAAIGQKLEPTGFDSLEMTKKGNISADEATYRTSLEGVFAVGDATNKGASIAIEAIGEANRAAQVIDAYLNGREISYRRPFVSEREVTENAQGPTGGRSPMRPGSRCRSAAPKSAVMISRRSTSALPRRMPAPRQPAVWSAAATTMPTVSSSAAPTSTRFTLSVWKVSSIRALWRKNWFALSVTRESVSSATSVCGPVMKWRARPFWAWWAADSRRSSVRSSTIRPPLQTVSTAASVRRSAPRVHCELSSKKRFFVADSLCCPPFFSFKIHLNMHQIEAASYHVKGRNTPLNL